MLTTYTYLDCVLLDDPQVGTRHGFNHVLILPASQCSESLCTHTSTRTPGMHCHKRHSTILPVPDSKCTFHLHQPQNFLFRVVVSCTNAYCCTGDRCTQSGMKRFMTSCRESQKEAQTQTSSVQTNRCCFFGWWMEARGWGWVQLCQCKAMLVGLTGSDV